MQIPQLEEELYNLIDKKESLETRLAYIQLHIKQKTEELIDCQKTYLNNLGISNPIIPFPLNAAEFAKKIDDAIQLHGNTEQARIQKNWLLMVNNPDDTKYMDLENEWSDSEDLDFEDDDSCLKS